VAQSLHNIGYTLTELGRYDEADEALHQALEWSENSKARDLARATRERLAVLAELQGDHAAALEHVRAEMQLREDIMDASKQRAIAAMQAQYETAQTERELALLRQQQLHDREQLAANRRVRNMALAGMIGLGLILFLLFSRYRLRVRANRDISAKRDELETLDRIVTAINRETDLKELLAELLRQALGFFGRADKGAVLLLDRRSMHYAVVALQGYHYPHASSVRLGQSQTLQRYTQGGKKIGPGVYLHQKMPPIPGHPELSKNDPAASLVAMMLDVGQQTEGVLVLQADDPRDGFCSADGEKFVRLRSHAINAVAKIRQIDERREQRTLAEQAVDRMEQVQQALCQLALVYQQQVHQ